MRLVRYKGTKDLKKLSLKSLRVLASDIRKFLIKSVSDTGGHLASNLGVVELTLALHTVFDTPKDKIVWDVGHQSYVHKILTGRKHQFINLRKYGGLSGFPKINESEHDTFGTGHSSTSISVALGLALARDIKGGDEKVVAVIGDGSMTGGLAYEGLNNAGRANTGLLVVLNDNGMSISKNVGAISKHLNQIRTASGYLDAKVDVQNVLDKLPVVGESISKGIKAVKETIKHAILPGVLFEELGFKYIGPIDGHDIEALLNVLERVKNIKTPVLLHVLTKKGKGYNKAENSPSSFHGIGTFCINTGKPLKSTGLPSYTDIFSDYICEKALENKNIVAITAAMPDGTGLGKFKEKFPKRFFDVGIAESHAVTFAAGLARAGLRPVVGMYSSFLQRAYDQVLHDVAIQKLPVIFAVDHGGAVAGDGETHQGIYDISFLSHIPNLIILAPSSGEELRLMFDYALTCNAPVVIRYPKDIAVKREVPPIYFENSEEVIEGDKIAIVSVGVMFETARQVANSLIEKGHSPALINARFVKPVDIGLASRLVDFDYIFTIEDGAKVGGFNTMLISEMTLISNREGKTPPKIYPFAFPDLFLQVGTRNELFKNHCLNFDSIITKIDNLLGGMARLGAEPH